MSPKDLVANYVLECRGQGHFLPYQDYQVLHEWLQYAQSVDDLLVVLSEVLPDFYGVTQSKGAKPRSLLSAKKRVVEKLTQLRSVQMMNERT